jgi:hypothetical protein
MKNYSVTIPIAGHVYIEVEAENEEDAKNKAFENCPDGDIEWDALESFNTGNVCHCPAPWEIEITEEEH